MLTLGIALLLVGYAFIYNGAAKWSTRDGSAPSLSENLGLPPGSVTIGKSLGTGSAPPTGGNQTGQPPSTVNPPPGGNFFDPFPSMGGPFI